MSDLVLTQRQDSILTIGLNRPDKRNALNPEIFRGLSKAYRQLCDDPGLRCGVLYSTGPIFSSGLDLMEMAPALMGQEGDAPPAITEENEVDPFNWASLSGQVGRLRSKPLVCAVNGACYAGGIEVMLGSDIVVAEVDSVFAQAEIRRGLMPLGGAIERFVSRLGWGNAMRWLLTGDEFTAAEAHRLGLVQELVDTGSAFDRAIAVAERIASAAPIGVRGTLENAYLANSQGNEAAANHMAPYVLEKIAPSKGLQEGINAMFEKREPVFPDE